MRALREPKKITRLLKSLRKRAAKDPDFFQLAMAIKKVANDHLGSPADLRKAVSLVAHEMDWAAYEHRQRNTPIQRPEEGGVA